MTLLSSALAYCRFRNCVYQNFRFLSFPRQWESSKPLKNGISVFVGMTLSNEIAKILNLISF